MTDTLIISGHSDDLIEVEGAIREEYSALDDEGGGLVVGASDGTAVRIRYADNGVWRITPVATGPQSTLSIVQAPEDDDDNYSDVATITCPDGAIRWVICGVAKVKAGER